jgi:hypothetical protein
MCAEHVAPRVRIRRAGRIGQPAPLWSVRDVSEVHPSDQAPLIECGGDLRRRRATRQHRRDRLGSRFVEVDTEFAEGRRVLAIGAIGVPALAPIGLNPLQTLDQPADGGRVASPSFGGGTVSLELRSGRNNASHQCGDRYPARNPRRS